LPDEVADARTPHATLPYLIIVRIAVPIYHIRNFPWIFEELRRCPSMVADPRSIRKFGVREVVSRFHRATL